MILIFLNSTFSPPSLSESLFPIDEEQAQVVAKSGNDKKQPNKCMKKVFPFFIVLFPLALPLSFSSGSLLLFKEMTILSLKILFFSFISVVPLLLCLSTQPHCDRRERGKAKEKAKGERRSISRRIYLKSLV
jgi:hypothetical protein